ncbi:MAG: hypothetical protein J6Y94_07330 [Bacteriovoracaceae bacterium]|nr:hypothetical protein [Bacteriovoracaceae bacterium]
MALEVIIYPSQEVLSKLWTEHPTATIIVPDPPRADLWRARWGHTGAAVQTINEWQTAELERCFGRERRASSKAYMMLYLGRALREGWQRQWVPRDAVEGLDFHWFNQAYTLLSDLRSFTLDFSLLHDLWPLHPQLAEAVQFLQQCLELGDCWDEHQVYAQLSAKYHDPQVPPPLTKTVIFWGFAHLSAMQVDYLKALGERIPVIVPYPAKAWQHSLPSDWIRWLSPLGPEEIKTTFSLPAQGQYQLASFPGGRLAASLGALNFTKESNLFLLTQDLKWPSQEIAQANTAAKIRIDIWQPIIEQIWQSLQDERYQHGSFNEQINDYVLSLEQWTAFLQKLGKQIQRQAALGDLAAGRWFKVWSLLKQLGEEWQGLSTKSFTIAGFELALWRQVIYQRVPRVYGLTTPAQTTQAIKVFDLNALPFYDRQKYNVVVAASSFERWRPLGEKYREEELRILTSLGPIFREEVAYQAQLQSLAELLQGPTLLLVEENLI